MVRGRATVRTHGDIVKKYGHSENTVRTHGDIVKKYGHSENTVRGHIESCAVWHLPNPLNSTSSLHRPWAIVLASCALPALLSPSVLPKSIEKRSSYTHVIQQEAQKEADGMETGSSKKDSKYEWITGMADKKNNRMDTAPKAGPAQRDPRENIQQRKQAVEKDAAREG